MDLGINNKVAIVTGASAGLGKAIAISLIKEGVKVAISARTEKNLLATVREIEEETNASVIHFVGDMTEELQVKHFVDLVNRQWGSIDILVNNVGQAKRGILSELSIQDWQKTIEVNLFSAILCSSLVIPYMQKQQWGRIINISALSGKEPAPTLIASNTIKAGLINFSKSLSQELAADHILVNCVSPGLIESPQNDRWFSAKEKEKTVAGIPLKRFGTPQEFSDAVTFLCSERAGYISGINLIIDGGSSHSV